MPRYQQDDQVGDRFPRIHVSVRWSILLSDDASAILARHPTGLLIGIEQGRPQLIAISEAELLRDWLTEALERAGRGRIEEPY